MTDKHSSPEAREALPPISEINDALEAHAESEKKRGRKARVVVNDFVGGVKYGIQWQSQQPQTGEGELRKALEELIAAEDNNDFETWGDLDAWDKALKKAIMRIEPGRYYGFPIVLQINLHGTPLFYNIPDTFRERNYNQIVALWRIKLKPKSVPR